MNFLSLRLGLFAITLLLLIAMWCFLGQNSHDHCKSLSEAISVCAASDMARPRDVQDVPLEHPQFDLGVQAGLFLQGARNETLGLQLILHRDAESAHTAVDIEISELWSSSGQSITRDNISLFQAWYHPVVNGGYKFGPPSDTLPWPGNYPDALIPQWSGCNPLRGKQVLSNFALDPRPGGNQAVWVDVYLPSALATGDYRGTINVKDSSGNSLDIPFGVEVLSVRLPDTPSFDAVGEIYQSYALEGAGKDKRSAPWRDMAHCYQILAHQHRMIFIERWNESASDVGWDAYLDYVNPILSGTLFSAENGYIGPGTNTPPTAWRTPWPQRIDRHLAGRIDDEQLMHWEEEARQWQVFLNENAWPNTYYFAYIFDEVDGDTDEHRAKGLTEEYLRTAHGAMLDVQAALDRGAGGPFIDLMWTSHSNPAQWKDQPGIDLAGTIRLWAPNGAAAAPDYLQQRKQLGERIWFYHDGHPSVGVHSVNASGIEMRSWGVIGARYHFDGQMMWAVNLGQEDKPFRQPHYKPEDDRFGNGVLVYPGKQLSKINHPAVPGPVPSMRLKAWRRGLQDAELVLLVRKEKGNETVDKLLKQLVPTALAEAVTLRHKKAQWSDDPADWINFRHALLRLAAKE
ncbi:MAG: DUF4091 domain-containing protein [Pseudomonadota bacterium]